MAKDSETRPEGVYNSRGEPKLSAQVKLWPTPTANDYKNAGYQTSGERAYPTLPGAAGATPRQWPTPRSSPNENRQTKFTPSQLNGTHGLSLCAAVNAEFFPTPRSTDGDRGGRGDLLQQVRGNPSPSGHFASHIPTPTSRDWKDGSASACANVPVNSHLGRYVHQDTDPDGGALNPDWVEFLMHWPLGWTSLAPLPIEAFNQWRTASPAAWFATEPPDVPRVALGVASRVDRLKALGNGQVPAALVLAWRLL